MSYLLGIGHATQDRLVRVRRFPEPDQKAETTPWAEGGGGPAATAVVAACRLGQSGRLAGVLGDDAVGRRIRAELVAEGVDVEALHPRSGRRSPCSLVVVEEGSARRTIFWDRGDAEPLEPGEIPPGLVEGAALLLVDGHQPAAQIAAAERARQAGVPVVLDAGSLRPATRELLPLADHAVVSERFASDWSGGADGEALAALRSAGPAVAVITLGERGCIGLHDAEVSVEALTVPAVDTNGAGDVFHGAYAVGLMLRFGLEERLRLAAAAAGLSCMVAGARPGIPGLEDALDAAGLRR